jgi:hypothetical protein
MTQPHVRTANQANKADVIKIVVVTTGEDLDDSFNVHEPIKVVFNRALKSVGGGAARADFTLEYNEQTLDLDKRISDYIEELGWTSPVTLELVPRPEVV